MSTSTLTLLLNYAELPMGRTQGRSAGLSGFLGFFFFFCLLVVLVVVIVGFLFSVCFVIVQELCESGGGPSWAVRPNEPSGFRGRKAILNHASALVSACP